MSYAHVKDGKVIKEGACPINLPNISNFYKANDEFKIQQGYYPVITVSESKKPWQNKSGQTYEIKEDFVEKTIIYSNITLDEYKSQRINELNNYLTPKYPELYKQINADREDIYSEEENVIILTSVTTWRNYYYLWKGNIESCTTYEEVQDIDYRTEEDKLKDEQEMLI